MTTEIKQLQTRLKCYLSRYLNTPEDIEDLSQEAITRVLEAASRGEIEYPKAYLYRTAHNLALNSLALKSRQILDYIEELADPDSSGAGKQLEDQVVAQQQFELFCTVTAELPEQCRKVLILRKVYGFSQREVASRLGISISTVEKHVAKGLLRCATAMERRPGSGAHGSHKAGSSQGGQL